MRTAKDKHAEKEKLDENLNNKLEELKKTSINKQNCKGENYCKRKVREAI